MLNSIFRSCIQSSIIVNTKYTYEVDFNTVQIVLDFGNFIIYHNEK